MTFVIQALDHDEGTGARWFDLKNARFDTKEEARSFLHKLRATDDEESMYSYRVVEEDSSAYYSQPTDVLEY